jgi:peptide/nickel transport system permease protein
LSLRAYIITRALLAIPMILILVTIVFIIMRVMPGDPVRVMLRPGAPAEYVEEIRHQLDLDKPLFINLRGSSAVVTQPGVILREGPSYEEPEIPLDPALTEGDQLQLTDRVTNEEGEWIRVYITEEADGWAPIEWFSIRINPIDSQYFDYIFALARLDFGESITPVTGRPVITDLKAKFPKTLELSIAGMAIAIVIGVFAGAFSAHKRGSPADYGIRLYGIIIYAIPVFWLGLMLQLVFGIYLGWLPVQGMIGTGLMPEPITGMLIVDSILRVEPASLISAIKHLILPSVTLGLYISGVFIRLTRANMLQTLRQDFITAARARGINERVVVYQHALKNAFIPILTMMGLQFAILLAGAVLTETTFNWEGMGRFLVRRIELRDYPSIQSTIVFFALLVTAVSLIVDIVYARLDPRIRY